MGKIFKNIEDLVEEGGKYDIPDVDNSGTQKDLSERKPPEPGPTPKQGKDDPKPPNVDSKEFEERGRPPEASEFDHQKNAGERPGEASPFQHEQREDLRPDKTSPFQHQERGDRDIQGANQTSLPESENTPSKAEPFDHVSEARNRPDDVEQFDHVSASDRENIKRASKFPHEENAGERPSKTSPFGHEDNAGERPDRTSPFGHEEDSDLRPSETSSFGHEEDEDLTPGETSPFGHEENESLKPDETSPFGHEENADLQPSETAPFEHEENETLTPDETSPFGHEENQDLRPDDATTFEHEEDEELTPPETAPFEHEQDEELRPSDDQSFEHEEDEELIPPEASPFEHEEDEDLRPPESQTFEHEQNEELQPPEDEIFEHGEDEELTPSDTTPFEHEEDEDLRPPDTTPFQHEEDESLRPPEDEIFEHEQDEELTPSDTTPFEHEQDESLQPPEDEIFEHEQDEELTPSDTQPFQHEEDESLRPPDTTSFEHEEDEELRPPDDEVFEHEQDESLQPSDITPFEHEQDESLQPSDDEIFEHEQDESLQPPEDEVFEHTQNEELEPSDAEPFEHQEDEELRPSDDEVFEHEQDEELEPSDAEPFEHQEDEELRPSDDEVFEHEQDESLQPPDDEVYEHEQNVELRPPDVYEFPLSPSENPIGPTGDVREEIQDAGDSDDAAIFWSSSEGAIEIRTGPPVQAPETNEEIRQRQISELWDVGGFSANPLKGGAPYGVLTKPPDTSTPSSQEPVTIPGTGGSRANRRGSDTRAVPLQHTLDDQQRLANFLTSPKGLVFVGKQFALQIFNPRPRTQIYNPVSVNQSAIPYVRTTRHLSADDGSLGSVVNSLTGALKSSKFSDEIDENTLEWGYLINSIPVRSDARQRDSDGPMAGSFEEGLSGADFEQAVEEEISANIDKVVYRHQVKRGAQKKLSQIKDAALSALGSEGGEGRSQFNYFLGTRANTGFYTRDGIIVKRTDRGSYSSYNFSFPYVGNISEVSNPVGVVRTNPEFNFPNESKDAFEIVEGVRTDDILDSDQLLPKIIRNPDGETGLSTEVSDRIKEASTEIRSSKNLATAFFGRSDGIGSIAEYENLPKQEDDPSILNAKPGVGDAPGAPGMKAIQDTDKGSESSFYQNKISEESPLNKEDHAEDYGPEVILHQGHSKDDQKSYGLPSYWEGGPGDDTGDLIGELGIIDLGSENAVVDDYEYETDSGKKFEDLVPFKIKDKQNEKLLVFRSFFESLSMNSNVQWDSQQYLGRPEEFHIYTGAQREMQVSFHLHPFSHDGLKAQWEKLNYLQGLIYPADYVFLGSDDQNNNSEDRTNVGAYMIPPFLELTVGDIYRDQNGFISSLSINPDNETTWSMVKGEKLPEHVTVDMTYTIIEDTAAQTGTKFYDTKAVPEPEM